MKKLITLILISFLSMPHVSADIFSRNNVENLELYVGQIKTVSVHEPTSLKIDKPEVVDVVKATSKEIMLVARAKGKTILTWEDKYGMHSIHITVYLKDMSSLKESIDEIVDSANLPNVHTRTLDGENKVIILGEVKSIADKEMLISALGPLKEEVVDVIKVKEEEVAVEIEAQILELSKGGEEKLGIKWPNSLTLTEPAAWRQQLQTIPDAFFRVSEWSRNTLSATIDWLEQEGNARVLSRPKLLCRSGREAKLNVGGEVPVLTANYTDAGVLSGSVEYKEYGIILTIRPMVDENNRIHLGLLVEVSELGDTVETEYAFAYEIIKRDVETELSLNDGETLVIGGLIRQKSSEDLQKFPWLADIPILGNFFKHTARTSGGGISKKEDTELFITLTPKIVNTKRKPSSVKAEGVIKKQKDGYLNTYESLEIPQNVQAYILAVHEKILDNIGYPAVLLGTGWTGDVVLKMTIEHTGELRNVGIIKSSGYKIFDEEAVKLAQSLSYPPFPSNIDLNEVKIEIPIVYRPR